MKALTLWRPWSEAIVNGPKRIENRRWAPPRHVLGKYIAIHAGKHYECGSWPVIDGYTLLGVSERPLGIVGVARVRGFVQVVAATSGGRTFVSDLSGTFLPAGASCPITQRMQPPADEEEWVRRVADARDDFELPRWLNDPWFAGDPLAPEPESAIGWVLEDVQPIEAVPCRGAQGLWTVPQTELELVRKRWREARHG